MCYSIDSVNQMGEPEFVEVFGAVFEKTPQIARCVWGDRPFLNREDLHQKMVAVVEQMTLDDKIALIRAHPELGKPGKIAAASAREQASAGFSSAAQEDYQQITELNAQYRKKFEFPFVMAVKGQTLKSIEADLKGRIGNKREEEIVRSLSEIYEIARFRLSDLI